MGLGPVHTVSLAEARELATDCRRMLLKGTDPIDARAEAWQKAKLDAARGMTFRAAAERYIKAHAPGWRNPKHRPQWANTLASYAYPILGTLPVEAIDTDSVMRAVEPIWTEKPETATRVRGRIEAVLDWSAVRGYRKGENPARWRGHLDKLLPARSKVAPVRHHAALPWRELPSFMVDLRRRPGGAARALEFVILTAARTGQARGTIWYGKRSI